jgi:pyruvate dehydrogenase E1 component
MTANQVATLRQSLDIAEGQEWEPFAGLTETEAQELEDFTAQSPFGRPAKRRFTAPPVPIPERGVFPVPDGAEQSTQMAFGRILNELAKTGGQLADRIVTTSPDVTVSTNLGGFVNQRGLFRQDAAKDVFRDAKIPSPQKWLGSRAGQHIELGIAEHNLFLNLAALGLSAPLYGEQLFPIGTVYDPFICRGLDALNYACYQDARFMLVATPSGLTLGPEGGAHQSIYTPLIGIGQPNLTYFEPAFVDELSEVMRWSFEHMQADDGGSVYLRLTTRTVSQPTRTDDAWRENALKGGYWLKAPGENADAAIVFCGAIAPEVLQAVEQLADDLPGIGVLNVVSPGLLHRDWMAARRGRWVSGEVRKSHAEILLDALAPGAGLVTVVDGSPATLSWLGGVRGMPVSPLGLDSFGQVGSLPDLYRHYRLDAEAIVEACADLFLR